MANQPDKYVAEDVSPEPDALLVAKTFDGEPVLDPVEVEAKWEKRVVILLWIAIALLMVLGGIILYAGYHGLFRSSPDRTTPVLRGPPDL